MSDSLNIRELILDFVLGDRRLEDRPGGVRIFLPGETAPPKDTVRRRKGGRYWIPYPDITILFQSRLSDEENVELLLLSNFFSAYDAMQRHPEAPLRVFLALALDDIGRHLSLSYGDIASKIGTTEDEVIAWRTCKKPPGVHLADWYYALGLFLQARNALVRVIDVSPELIRLLKENPSELRHLRADQFESFVANRLDRMGFNVTLTGSIVHRDGGIDIIAVPKTLNAGSFVLAAQVKHHEGDRKTGRDAVDRLASWNGPFRLGMLVTNTGFTKDAVWMAARERNKDFIRLRDFNDLKRWLEDQYGSPEDWKEIPETIELAPGVVIEVPKPKIVPTDMNR